MPKHKEDFERLRPTGLRKVCPRCRRMGTVYVNLDLQTFTIMWEGAPRGMHGGEFDRDIGLNWHDLLSRTFGCGYDKHTKKEI